MTEAVPPTPLSAGVPRAAEMFPILTPAQLSRIMAHGRLQQVQKGEVLVRLGEPTTRFFVVIAGQVELLRRLVTGDGLFSFEPGMFTGEVNMLSGRRALVEIRANGPAEVVELDRERLLSLVQTDSELSDVFMRAFILRRVEIIAHGAGGVVVVGSAHCAGTLRVKEFLTRNGHPYSSMDLDRDPDAQELLDRFHVTVADVPVVICRGETVLRNPTNQQIADCLGFNEAIDKTELRDLIVVGAGPSGLAAAVYGA